MEAYPDFCPPHEPETKARCMPSLVQLCQRAIALNVDRLDSIEGVRLELVKPMLERCTAETLLRLEQASPELLEITDEIWKSLCFKSYPLAAQSLCMKQDPESWRESFFVIREREAKRFEDVGQRLRMQREEAEQRKKEGQVRFTDRLPPVKRRGWIPAPPKTLIQKTRSDAAKLQKGIYGQRRMIPMPANSYLRSLPNPSPSLPSRATSTAAATSGSRVTVTAVSVRRNSSTTPNPPLNTATAISQTHHPVVTHSQGSPNTKRQRTTFDSDAFAIAQSSPNERPIPLKPPLPKKDPKASLFMPKHRTFSQLPTAPGVRSRS
ncbi:RNA polymerase II transcription factor SIII subunit A-domain-containing protein [Cristinia sonorae]|uniref:RNA polymerase II transcription factor SIII subunit A-domain-containing protein n=1 Tax=Cristinia sonorae TaxID=1940300 RepID=A0A8K0UY56_9AGAR|nr:RNA polymerase II transcription factor SIII subunit A-domain-containing protein [Cristinia sonorae]